LARTALATIPVSMVLAGAIAKRSRPQFVRQWEWTGKVNSHIEEMYTGHELVMVFGNREQSAQEFAERNETLYEASFKAQYISGIIQPAIGFVAHLNYLVVAVVGALRVASGTDRKSTRL